MQFGDFLLELVNVLVLRLHLVLPFVLSVWLWAPLLVILDQFVPLLELVVAKELRMVAE